MGSTSESSVAKHFRRLNARQTTLVVHCLGMESQETQTHGLADVFEFTSKSYIFYTEKLNGLREDVAHSPTFRNERE